VDKTLIAANMQPCYDRFLATIGQGGKIAVLFTDAIEFIWGDGFLHNFSHRLLHQLNPRCIIPLTPGITVVFTKPAQYWTEPSLMTMRVSRDEAIFLNNTIQVYSKDAIFYRAQKPSLLRSFGERQHFQYEYHHTPWLERLLESIASFIPSNQG
jgi:hypothetical protein